MTSTSRVTVGTATGGTLVASNDQTWQDGAGRRQEMHVWLAHAGAAGTAYLGGGTAVSASSGYPYASTAGALAVTLDPGEQLWAIGAATGGTLAVLTTGT